MVIGSGSTSTNFSSEGALEGLTEGNFTFSDDGITFTDSVEHSVGPDEVTADIAATLKPDSDPFPPRALGRDVRDGAIVAGAADAAGDLAWGLLFKVACSAADPGAFPTRVGVGP
jgi:hypothetical protein